MIKNKEEIARLYSISRDIYILYNQFIYLDGNEQKKREYSECVEAYKYYIKEENKLYQKILQDDNPVKVLEYFGLEYSNYQDEASNSILSRVHNKMITILYEGMSDDVIKGSLDLIREKIYLMFIHEIMKIYIVYLETVKSDDKELMDGFKDEKFYTLYTVPGIEYEYFVDGYRSMSYHDIIEYGKLFIDDDDANIEVVYEILEDNLKNMVLDICEYKDEDLTENKDCIMCDVIYLKALFVLIPNELYNKLWNTFIDFTSKELRSDNEAIYQILVNNFFGNDEYKKRVRKQHFL